MKGYILAGAAGAVAGGIVVARTTKAIPKIMEMMSAH
jgi:outer membrane lipoprotein SlyB